jgi:hypothetical protein
LESETICEKLNPAVFVAAFAISLFQLCSFDLFWHFRAGEYFFQNGAVLDRNLFSWTHPDYPWVPTYWLFEVAVYALFRVAGFSGLVVSRALVVAFAYGTLAGYALRVMKRPAIVCVIFLAILEMSYFRFLLRPHLSTLLGLCLLIPWCDRYRRRAYPGWAYALLPAGFCLWANLHSGVIFGLCLMAIHAFTPWIGGRGFESGTSGKPSFSSRLWMTVACSAAVLFNPTGWGFLEYLRDHLTLDSVIPLEEMAPFDFSRHPKQSFLFFILWGMPLFLLLAEKRFSSRHLATALFSLFLLAKGIRFLPVSALLCLPAAFDAAGTFVAAAPSPARRRTTNALCVMLALGYAWHVHAHSYSRPESPFRTGFGVDERAFPVRACRRLDPAGGIRLFNSLSAGGYVAWFFDDAVPVFQDGRIHAYPPRFFRALQSAAKDPKRWRRWIERYGIDTVLLRIDECTPAQIEVLEDPGWKTVYRDAFFILAARKG